MEITAWDILRFIILFCFLQCPVLCTMTGTGQQIQCGGWWSKASKSSSLVQSLRLGFELGPSRTKIQTFLGIKWEIRHILYHSGIPLWKGKEPYIPYHASIFGASDSIYYDFKWINHWGKDWKRIKNSWNFPWSGIPPRIPSVENN